MTDWTQGVGGHGVREGTVGKRGEMERGSKGKGGKCHR